MKDFPHGGRTYGETARLDFSANINPLGLAPEVKQVIAENDIVIRLGTSHVANHQGDGVTVLNYIIGVVTRRNFGRNGTGGQQTIVHRVLRGVCRRHLPFGCDDHSDSILL